jgi:hypothetical protein
MNRTVTAVVLLFVVFALAAGLTLGNALSHNTLTAMRDGSQPPVPPKDAFLDGSQPPVPPKMTDVSARMLDGSQPPVPPKMMPAFASVLDGSQPPVPPKTLQAGV